MSSSEKRKDPRYVVSASAEIMIGEEFIQGTVKDISFGGFFVKEINCSSNCEGKEAEIKIVADLNSGSYCIEGKSRIVRYSDKGIGLFFIGMDDENITALNKLILNLSMQESAKNNK